MNADTVTYEVDNHHAWITINRPDTLNALDIETLTWSELDSGNGPDTRMHAHLEYDEARDRYLLFGGHTDIGDGNDLWEMDPETEAEVDRLLVHLQAALDLA